MRHPARLLPAATRGAHDDRSRGRETDRTSCSALQVGVRTAGHPRPSNPQSYNVSAFRVGAKGEFQPFRRRPDRISGRTSIPTSAGSGTAVRFADDAEDAVEKGAPWMPT